MTDRETAVAELREVVARFVREREWEQFHSPKNLAMALAVEAGELMEHFLWIDTEASRQVVADPARLEAVADEMADVACLLLALMQQPGRGPEQQYRAEDGPKYPEIPGRQVPGPVSGRGMSGFARNGVAPAPGYESPAKPA